MGRSNESINNEIYRKTIKQATTEKERESVNAMRDIAKTYIQRMQILQQEKDSHAQKRRVNPRPKEAGKPQE